MLARIPQHNLSASHHALLTILIEEGTMVPFSVLGERMSEDFGYNRESGVAAIHRVIHQLEKTGYVQVSKMYGKKSEYQAQPTRKGFTAWTEQLEFFRKMVELCSDLKSKHKPEEYLAVTNESVKEVIEERRVKERAPTPEEIEKLLSVADRKFVILYRVSLETGVRPPDYANALIENVNLDKGELILEEKSLTGRTIKNRHVTLNEKAVELIKEAIGDRQEGVIFIYWKGEGWYPEALSRKFREYRERAGLPKEITLAGRGGKHWNKKPPSMKKADG